MRTGAMVLGFMLAASLAFGSVARAAVPDRGAAPIQMAFAGDLTGSRAELESALRERASVSYKILVVDEDPADRTAYLDEVLAAWGWPAEHELLLVVYPNANFDLRFAMGAFFRSRYVTVAEMTDLVRSEYFPRSQRGDAYGGLAALVRAVNRRMSTDGGNRYQARFEAMRQVVALIECHDVAGLLAMAPPGGLHAAPYAVGLPAEGLTPERARALLTGLVEGAQPQIAAYNLTQDDLIQVVVQGLTAGRNLPASGGADSQVKSTERAVIGLRRVDGAWKLTDVAFDPAGLALQHLEENGFTRPFGWFKLKTGADSFMAGFGSLADGQSNTTQVFTTTSRNEALAYLSLGVKLPTALDGKPMLIHRSFTVDYQPLTTSLMVIDPSFSASFSPIGKHVGEVQVDEHWSVQTEQRTINGRPALIIALDQKQEGGWRNRYLLIEDGNWLYHLEDGQGNLEKLLQLAEQIPPIAPAPTTADQAPDWRKLSDAERLKIARDLLTNRLSAYKGEGVAVESRLLDFRIDTLAVDPPRGSDGYPMVMAVYSVQPLDIDHTSWMAGNGEVENGWVARKTQWLRIGWQGGAWAIEAMGTSP